MSKKFWILLLVVLSLTPGAFAQEATNSSSLPLMLGNLGSILTENLNASTILGTPIQAGDVTLIPVTMKCFGLGLGEGLRSEGASESHEKASEESSKDRKHACGGLGGAARPIAIIVVKKDGNVQILKLQHESWIAQGVQALVPVLNNMVNKRFEVQIKRQEAAAGTPAAGAPVQPPAPPQQGK